MSFSLPSIKGICVAAVLAVASSVSNAAVIFQDGFETGNFATTSSGGARWGDKAQVTVSTDRAVTGTYSSKFHFPGNPSGTGPDGWWSELRFDLGRVYPEVWVKFKLYIPSNYYHRSLGAANNKIYRIWGTDYGNIEKVGYSTWPEAGNSTLITDWNLNGAGIGPKGDPSYGFITSTDKGRWMDLKIYTKAATVSAPGTMKIWKNGTLIVDLTNQVNNYTAGEAHGYRYGYLLGNANSGFAETTDFYIDDVVFATMEADLGSGGGELASAPMPPILSVEVQ